MGFLLFAFKAGAEEKLNPLADTPANIKAGKEIYNSICFRCHGEHGITQFRARDLRRFNKKYTNWGENPDEIFLKVVMGGRLNKGMPAFPERSANQEIWKIKIYVNSIQNP